MSDPFLAVRGVTKRFPVERSFGDWVRRRSRMQLTAVDDVSFELPRRETLGIVGESGSGKSTLARCLIRLQEPDGGGVVFDGIDVTRADRETLRGVRRRIQMVFQDPYSSLNPRLTVGKAILEAGLVHGQIERKHGNVFVRELLAMVGLPDHLAGRRPLELSGGQRQRVAIARALAVEPDVLVGDEAVSSLDVSVQAQILNLFEDLRQRLDLTMIFISHQLSVIAHISDSVAVMYLGRIVEQGQTAEIFTHPQHPYTRGLLDANPTPDPLHKRHQPAIRGELPSPLAMPTGCRFRTRCPFAEEVCAEVDPILESVGPSHLAACHVLPFRHQLVPTSPREE